MYNNYQINNKTKKNMSSSSTYDEIPTWAKESFTLYTPHVDTGDFIVVVNADKVAVTGNKEEGKLYHHHTGYPGGLKTTNFKKLQEKHPIRIIEKSVKGMLPKNPLGRSMIKKLKIYDSDSHNHGAQNPIALEI